MPLIKKEKTFIDSKIEENINELIKDQSLKDILFYSLENGKRVRPIIISSIYNKDNKQNDIYLVKAFLTIEYIHTSSLIIDDIMDNDNDRRGKETIHSKYGLTIAQLSAVILCSLAMQNLFECFNYLNNLENYNKNIPIIMFGIISNLIKDLGVGQYLDISLTSSIFDIGNNIKNSVRLNKIKDNIEELIHKKTSSLFEYCFIMPWILKNYNKKDLEIKDGINKMKELSHIFGLIFQISDDFEDIRRDLERDGKNAVMNYVINKGYYNAYSDYNNFVKEFKEKSIKLNILSEEIKEIITFLSDKVEFFYKNKLYI